MSGSNIDNNLDSPLIMIQPMNIILLMVFYSPEIIAICVVSMSFIFQNLNN